ncbi:hypothetical protein [Methylobacterium sp. WL18]|nr:hypothetical protein [Methylobacterium sp. WL18]
MANLYAMLGCLEEHSEIAVANIFCRGQFEGSAHLLHRHLPEVIL